jgi:hypothetical protein
LCDFGQAALPLCVFVFLYWNCMAVGNCCERYTGKCKCIKTSTIK